MHRARIAAACAVAASLLLACVRLFFVSSPSGETPFQSANDRSRWSAVRALVDHGTFELDPVLIKDPNATVRKEKYDLEWETIDKVRHKGWDGREHYYSSKPVLSYLPHAAIYAALKATLGLEFARSPFTVARIILLLTQILPFGLGLWLFSRYVLRKTTSSWTVGALITFAGVGTLLAPFLVTLNNHVPAAIAVGLALTLLLRTDDEQAPGWGGFLLMGLFAGYAAANELPALSFACLLGGYLLLRSPAKTLLAYVPGAALVAVAAFGANYLAHGQLRPPYAMRQDGPLILHYAADRGGFEQGRLPKDFRDEMKEQGYTFSSRTTVERSERPGRFVLWDPATATRLALIERENGLDVRQWGNWYDYPGSYWYYGRKSGVDQGEPSRAAYAFHVLIGHHGVFSLTPMWLLAIPGTLLFLRRDWRRPRTAVAWMTLVVTVVCLGFYILRPLEDRNYGGVASGLRWAFWLIPFWLIAIVEPTTKLMQRPLGVAVVLLLFAASCFSATEPWSKPWQHPWLYRVWPAKVAARADSG
jgi:hypothetical protein